MFQVENRGPTKKKSPGQQEALSPTPIDDVVVLISSVCGDWARVRGGGGWVCLCTGGIDCFFLFFYKQDAPEMNMIYLDSGFDAGSGEKKKRGACLQPCFGLLRETAALSPAHHGPYCQCPLDADCHACLVVFFSVETRNYYMTVPPPQCSLKNLCVLIQGSAYCLYRFSRIVRYAGVFLGHQ